MTLEHISCCFISRLRLFKRLDVNGDNKMDFKEFQNALHHEGITASHDMERECFDEMDKDRTGFLNSEEFIVALRVGLRPGFLNSEEFIVALRVDFKGGVRANVPRLRPVAGGGGQGFPPVTRPQSVVFR